MKIADIKTHLLGHNLKRPFGFSQWYYSRRVHLVVEVLTDDGITGLGECYGPADTTRAAIDGFYKPRLKGLDPMRHEFIWNLLWKSSLDYARKGPMMAAISGVDLALWDIKGKALKCPVRRLLGGAPIGKIPCYATGMYFEKGISESRLIRKLLREADGYVRQGYPVIKIKIGKNPTFDRGLIRAMRKTFDHLRIAADANHAYNLKEALAIGHVLEENDFEWFEEPVSPEHYADYGVLRRQLAVKVAGGECEQTRFGFQQLLSRRSVDIAQPDLAYAGGITEAIKIHALANASGVDVIPHCWGTRINQAAAASFITMLHENPGRLEAGAALLEADCTENPVRDGLCSTHHEIRNGHIHFNHEPGLGVELDRKALRKFTV